MGGIGWEGMLDPTNSLVNSVIRGSIVYLALFGVLRMMHNRRSGSIGLSDLLLVTLVSGAVENSMVGEGRSLTEGAVVAGTIFFWSFALDWLAFRFPRLRWLVRSQPQTVVKDGQVVHAGLRRELLTRDDLLAQLREQGIDDLGQVRLACVEANGTLSVLLRDEPGPAGG
jgi:uncharacterized membrane protein YcaP (DUF421 family)